MAVPLDEALTHALNGIDSDVVRSVTIGNGPTDARSGPWMYGDVQCSDPKQGGCLYASWQMALVQGATAQLSAGTTDDLANVIVGASTLAHLPDGTTSQLVAGAGDAAANQSFPGDDDTDPAITDRIAQLVNADGYSVQNVRVFRPLGPAPAVYVVVPSISAYTVTLGALQRQLDAATNGGAEYEALYLQMQLPDGTIIGRASSSALVAYGGQDMNDSLGLNSGIPHG